MQYMEAKQAGLYYNRRDLVQLKSSNIHERQKKGLYILSSHEMWKEERFRCLQEEDKESVHLLEGRWGEIFEVESS